jgi:hypothetical protein
MQIVQYKNQQNLAMLIRATALRGATAFCITLAAPTAQNPLALGDF